MKTIDDRAAHIARRRAFNYDAALRRLVDLRYRAREDASVRSEIRRLERQIYEHVWDRESGDDDPAGRDIDTAA